MISTNPLALARPKGDREAVSGTGVNLNSVGATAAPAAPTIPATLPAPRPPYIPHQVGPSPGVCPPLAQTAPQGLPTQGPPQPQPKKKYPCRMCGRNGHQTFECGDITPQTPMSILANKGIALCCLGEVSHPGKPHQCSFNYVNGTRTMTKEYLCCNICGYSRR